MRIKYIIAAGAAALLCGCAASPVWISPGDPVLTACQQPAIANVANLQGTVDRANDTNPAAGWSGDQPEQMTSTDVANLRKAAGSLRAWAAQVDAGHHWFANALRDEAQQYVIAAAAPRGLTVNSVALATDTYAHQIQAYCGRFRAGHAPAAGKPGPGLWDWGLFWLVAGGYLAAAVISSQVIALGERSRPRNLRLAPGQIALRSLMWWVFIIGAIIRAWLHSLARATLTKDDRQADRIAEQAAEIRRLEQLNKKLSRKDE
jgi:hypothetical protein